MPGDELTYAEIVEIVSRQARPRNLQVTSEERDSTLFVSILSRSSVNVDQARSTVTFWTSGTGAFAVDFDDRWSWQAFAYDRTEQEEAVQEIVDLADRYLHGAGEERTTKSILRRVRTSLEITVDGVAVTLQAHDSSQGRR